MCFIIFSLFLTWNKALTHLELLLKQLVVVLREHPVNGAHDALNHRGCGLEPKPGGAGRELKNFSRLEIGGTGENVLLRQVLLVALGVVDDVVADLGDVVVSWRLEFAWFEIVVFFLFEFAFAFAFGFGFGFDFRFFVLGLLRTCCVCGQSLKLRRAKRFFIFGAGGSE